MQDFGVGWTLDIQQGLYQNNRPPGDGWQITEGFLPCEGTVETKSHLTTIRLSDAEIYRFRMKLVDTAATFGGCFARAEFQFIEGPMPGSTLQILGNDEVFYENSSNQVIDTDTFELFEPDNVRLSTRDGRSFDLNLEAGVTSLEDLNGNRLEVSEAGISHSSGRGIVFTRDTEGRITTMTDPLGRVTSYTYDAAGDLVEVTDRLGGTARFSYNDEHHLLDFEDPRGIKFLRSEYDDDGRLVRHIDAFGKVVEFSHDLDGRFHGAWLDGDTGLYYMRARYYAPELGRFLSRDPVGLLKTSPEASHPYAFANGNPFLFEDPAGLFASVASFNVASAVQSSLNSMRAGFMRRLFRRLLEEAKTIALDAIKDLIIRSFLEAFGLGQYLNSIAGLAAKLEHGVQGVLCNILGPNRIPSFVWLEPKIDESGRPFADGFHCPVTPEKQDQANLGTVWNGGKKRQGPRPDFLLSGKRPTTMTSPFPFQSILPGGVKVSVHHAYETWTGDQQGQREALRQHANLYAIRNVLLITARGGTKVTCEKVEALFTTDLPPTLINIWSLTGVFSKRKSGC